MGRVDGVQCKEEESRMRRLTVSARAAVQVAAHAALYASLPVRTAGTWMLPLRWGRPSAER
jgi:hypothetical protein